MHHDSEGLYDEPAFNSTNKNNPVYQSHEDLTARNDDGYLETSRNDDGYLETGRIGGGGDGCNFFPRFFFFFFNRALNVCKRQQS